MRDEEQDLTVAFYVAEATLEIQEQVFYDNWRFLWDGELVRASVNKELEDVNLLTDHSPENMMYILNFIQNTLSRIKTGAPLEEENRN